MKTSTTKCLSSISKSKSIFKVKVCAADACLKVKNVFSLFFLSILTGPRRDQSLASGGFRNWNIWNEVTASQKHLPAGRAPPEPTQSVHGDFVLVRAHGLDAVLGPVLSFRDEQAGEGPSWRRHDQEKNIIEQIHDRADQRASL